MHKYQPNGCTTNRIVLVLLFWIGLVPLSVAEKVKLDPSNWGLEEGKECVSCHKKASAGLTHEWQSSAHAEAGVNCLDCHLADQVDNDAIEHEGAIIATIVSPKDCGRCHTREFKETEGSVHAKALSLIKNRLPALADNLSGKEMVAAGCAQCHGSKVKVRGDGTLTPETWPNTGIGRINPDGSLGSCSACHGRHSFSKAQARDPSACTWCHTGPESPDDEVYRSSKHGMLYEANRSRMNLESDQWVLGKDYSAAPTCVTCHMGATPGVKASHDVGMRDAWSLNRPVSEQQYLIIFEDGDRRELPKSQPAPRRGTELNKLDGSMAKVKAVATPERRRQIMKKVCLECHSKGFVKSAMKQFDDVVKLYNDKFGKPAQAIMSALYEMKLLTPAPFDEPIEFSFWRLWHDEGTAARHGAAMMSPNYASWEGMHKVGQNFYGEFLPQLRQLAGEEKANDLIKTHVTSLDQHSWLNNSSKPNPILGYGIGKESHE
ncbi:MAG: multiheme c-type cytochrome [Candidatus Thiodiazotropha sp. 6PLUC6]